MIRNARIKVADPFLTGWFSHGFRCADIVNARLPDDAVLLDVYHDDREGCAFFVFQSELFGDGPEMFDLEPTFKVADGCARPVVIGG